ncbi:hypothetical protein [Azospirillum sp.]|uniref:hypothetical protein n=1 Tax=Azospirillum sp. TaxID=34012 RepID=UPI003D739EF3
MSNDTHKQPADTSAVGPTQKQASLTEREAQVDRGLADEARAILKHEKVKALQSRERLARNLAVLIDTAKQHGAKPGEIVQRAGIRNTASSAVLSKYVVRGETTPAILGDLSQQAWQYLRLAEAAAQLGRFDTDRAVLDLVDGTSLDPRVRTTPAPEENVSDWLYDLIREAVGSISREYDLMACFADMRRHGVEYYDDRWTYSDSHQPRHETTTWPSVPLFIQIFDRVRGTMRRRGRDWEPAEIAFGKHVTLAIGVSHRNEVPEPYLLRFPYVLVMAANNMHARLNRGPAVVGTLLNMSLNMPDVSSGYPDYPNGHNWAKRDLEYRIAPERPLDLQGFKPDPRYSLDWYDLEEIERLTRSGLGALMAAPADILTREGLDAIVQDFRPGYIAADEGTIGALLEAAVNLPLEDGFFSRPKDRSTFLDRLAVSAQEISTSFRAWLDAEKKANQDQKRQLLARWSASVPKPAVPEAPSIVPESDITQDANVPPADAST